MSVSKVKCPICGKIMQLKETYDSIKQLECSQCNVIKKFSGWDEQREYEKAYENKTRKD